MITLRKKKGIEYDAKHVDFDTLFQNLIHPPDECGSRAMEMTINWLPSVKTIYFEPESENKEIIIFFENRNYHSVFRDNDFIDLLNSVFDKSY